MPVILFGAFDRHNFGDLLFAHIAAALLGERKLLYAGLAARDLCAYDGHRVDALPDLAERLRGTTGFVLHVGGEILTCEAWQAAVMLLPPVQATQVIKGLDMQSDEHWTWASKALGTTSLVPYAASPAAFPGAGIIYTAVGGVELDQCPVPLRSEVVAKLGAARYVSVRDRTTLAILESAGIQARLVPDPAVLVARLFDNVIRERAQENEMAHVLELFPNGYLAVQFSADFGDEATLAGIARQLDKVVQESGHGIVFFRAGEAPWHDDLEAYQHVAARMRAGTAYVFISLRLWDICAVLAHGRGYCGSSLHGRIVAMAYSLPRMNLVHDANITQVSKQRAYATTWDAVGMPAIVSVNDIADGMREALTVDAGQMDKLATELADLYLKEFDAVCDIVRTEIRS